MKVAYLHNLPLEYYPPASNFLNLLGRSQKAEVRVFTTRNRKQRAAYESGAVKITRSSSPNPLAAPLWRLLVALWWHLRTAFSLFFFRPDAIVYVEPHSAITAYLYYRIFRGDARLFIHHHEYYEREDYLRPGMRMPHIGKRVEHSYLFLKAEWISQTNVDRLSLVKRDNPDVTDAVWHVLPNYPPAAWKKSAPLRMQKPAQPPLRLIYVGSASFEDTYIEQVVRWVAAHPEDAELRMCGYNVSRDVWEWLAREQFPNVTCDADGYLYEDLPSILNEYDIGLVLYKGNTTNFVYNVPNKVFEYLRCGLDVWYPKEMVGIRNFQIQIPCPLHELDFTKLAELSPISLQRFDHSTFRCYEFTAESAFARIFDKLGIDDWARTT